MNGAKPAGTVIVVDDDLSVREALEGLLHSIGVQSLVFDSVPADLECKRPEGPCCLVLDVRLPGLSGFDLQRELTKTINPPPIIFITGHGDIPMSVRAMKAGAIEFLAKPFRDQDLLDAIQLGLDLDRAQLESGGAMSGLRDKYETLTTREREVMGLVATGLLNKQIADRITISKITVKVHRGQVMRKMEARSLADLVRMADKLGLKT